MYAHLGAWFGSTQLILQASRPATHTAATATDEKCNGMFFKQLKHMIGTHCSNRMERYLDLDCKLTFKIDVRSARRDNFR